MKINRRKFHYTTILFFLSLGLSGLLSRSKMFISNEKQPVKKRRILFNSDGADVFKSVEGNLQNWLLNIFRPIENSHVDALFWCDGAGGNTANYDSDVLELTGQRIGQVDPALVKLISEGNDPPKVVVQEAKKRGLDIFYSFRINDTHDARGALNELPTFKIEHPEWLIGDQPYGEKTALNFAIPEVRQLKLAVIKEIFQKYDFDGLEIDFMRGPPFFIPGQEPQNAPILTQFLRRVRQHLNHRGQERGRPIELAARVDENLGACYLDGFDVATWLREGLIDILILGSGVIDIEVEEFRELAEGTRVLIYPCLYGHPSRYLPIPEALARGLALNYWHQGADGIYTFNWYSHHPSLAYQIELLKQIGDPTSIEGKNLMFAADRRHAKSLRKFYPHNWRRAVLPAELSAGRTVEVPIMVGVDLAGARSAPPTQLNLRLECKNLARDDDLVIYLNGTMLEGIKRNNDNDAEVSASLRSYQLKQGKNFVSVTLARRNFIETKQPITIDALEIHVTFDSN